MPFCSSVTRKSAWRWESANLFPLNFAMSDLVEVISFRKSKMAGKQSRTKYSSNPSSARIARVFLWCSDSFSGFVFLVFPTAPLQFSSCLFNHPIVWYTFRHLQHFKVFTLSSSSSFVFFGPGAVRLVNFFLFSSEQQTIEVCTKSFNIWVVPFLETFSNLHTRYFYSQVFFLHLTRNRRLLFVYILQGFLWRHEFQLNCGHRVS